MTEKTLFNFEVPSGNSIGITLNLIEAIIRNSEALKSEYLEEINLDKIYWEIVVDEC